MGASPSAVGASSRPRDRVLSSTSSRALALGGLGIALGIGALARFWGLFGQSPFLDEAFTFDAAGRSVHDLLVQIATHDAHPPLFYLFTHALMTALPALPQADYRAFTASCGLVTIAVVWAIARRQLGDAAAFIAAVVVATEPSLVQLDRLYRMYAPLAALTAVSWWLLVALPAASGRRRIWLTVAYVACAAVLPSLQYLGGAVLASQLAYAGWLFVRDRARAHVLFAALGGAVAAAAALSWWVVWALPLQYHQGGYAGAGAMTQTWWEIPSGALGYGIRQEWFAMPWFAVSFAAFGIGVAAAGAWVGRDTIVPWYLLPVALQAAFSAATGKDLVLSRYLIHLVPAFALAAGALCAALLESSWRLLGLALALAILTLNGVALSDELLDPVYQTPDWGVVDRLVERYASPSDRMMLDDGYPYLIVRAMPGFAHRDTNAPTQSWQIPSALAWCDAAPARRVWYVENQYYYPDPRRQILAHLEKTRPREREWLEPRADLSNRVYIAEFGPMRSAQR